MTITPTPPPTPAPWEQPQYVATEPGKGLAIAALVCGIVGSVFGLIPITSLIAVALGLTGFVLGAIAWHKRGQAHLRRTMTVWGVVLSVLALTLGIIGMVIVNDAVNDINDNLEQIGPADSDSYVPPTEAEINAATIDDLYAMYGEAPVGSDSETRIEAELTERGEFG